MALSATGYPIRSATATAFSALAAVSNSAIAMP